MYQKVNYGQSLIDTTILFYGSIEALVDLAFSNNIQIDSEAAIGELITTPALALPKEVRKTEKVYANPFVKTAANQALMDIAIQESGNIESLIELALLNGVNITDDLAPDTLLRKSGVIDKNIVTLFKTNMKPASNSPVSEDQLPAELEGIDYWSIENTFIVS
ncbi:MAG: hypothetical protein Q8K66_13085 [Sediminibacterium sp.]|nr:hypothetical protein [Sediminibacterium sp.]MDP3128831.1 hypothetical protein [Sediminibacterium sp.]